VGRPLGCSSWSWEELTHCPEADLVRRVEEIRQREQDRLERERHQRERAAAERERGVR